MVYQQSCRIPARPKRDVAVPTLTPAELKARLDRGDDVALLDVREVREWEIGRIDGARLTPLGTIGDALGGLDRGREWVVYCKGGARSAKAVQQLRAVGFERVW